MVILTKNMGISRFFEVNDVAIPDNYEVQMIINNEMKYIPFSSLREINGKKSLSVKVDGLSTLSDKFRKSMPGVSDVKELMRDLRKCLREIGSYLLSPDSLILSTRYILYDVSCDKFSFLYVPGYRTSFKEQLKSLFEEIMRIYDHQDHNGVMYLYDLYSKVLGDNFTPELFLKMDDEESEPSKVMLEEETFEEDSFPSLFVEEESESVERRKDKEEESYKNEISNSKKWHIAVSVVAIVISIVLYILFGVMSFKVSALIVGILVAYLVIDYLRLKERQEEREEDLAMQQYQVSEAPPIHNELKKPLIREEYIETSVLSQSTSTSVSCLVPRDRNESNEIYLIEGETRVGRQKDICDYYLNDPSVSRVHAIFEKRGDRVTIRDAGSTNGTFVNDVRITGEEELEATLGDTVSIAGIQFECV